MGEYMKHEITIWVSVSKNRSRYIDGGERVVVELLKPEGRKNHQLRFTRQFFNYPEWDEASQCSFSINDVVLRKLIEILRKARMTL